ncbi:MAG: SGNH/GDSL hydrolase family protein [Candidatus Pacebacteria bacterium]|nr:SGNH/GDSL hydrolase family protein [Candidatus Paceibacterota bacterium]
MSGTALFLTNAAAAKGSYFFDFASDPREEGWAFQASQNEGGMSYNPAEGYYLDKGGKLISPEIQCADDRFQFYRMTFESKADSESYYAVQFADSNGDLIVADNYASVYPSEDWVGNDVCFRGRERGVSFKVLFQSRGDISVRNLTIQPVSNKDVVAWADRLYATLPEHHYHPHADRWKHIPKTMAKLRTGEPLRVVMLGDSIVNDTFNSLWEAFVKEAYPQARMTVVCSVRGATGAPYYQRGEHFKVYVEDLEPDLLIVGGISNGGTTEPLTNLLDLVDRTTGCEVLLMSGPMGPDWRPHADGDFTTPLPVLTPPRRKVYREMKLLASQRNIEFLDMYTIWHAYLAQSQKPWQWFHRDRVHACDRGKQILGRILKRYFQP